MSRKRAHSFIYCGGARRWCQSNSNMFNRNESEDPVTPTEHESQGGGANPSTSSEARRCEHSRAQSSTVEHSRAQ
eukprot:4514681-Pyramimonas_sp.AAC.1